jgi:5-amino-6-(5-phosphoribosylamino)uracil reductase
MDFRKLLPKADTVDLDQLLETLDLGAGATDRPYTVANFVSSADGRATFQGRSGALGDDGDKAMFHGLREHVDAVLVGTRTLAIERYGRILGKAERRERRRQRGAPDEPLACAVSRSGEIRADIPLFAEPEARVVLFVPEGANPDLTRCQAEVEVVRLDLAELTMTTALRCLRADYGVRSVLCEGGPTIFGALLHERVVDELFQTLAPRLTGGGTGPAISAGPELPEPRQLELVWALERAGSLFLRYRIG